MQITLQQAFDAALNGIRKQGRPSGYVDDLDPTGYSCQYDCGDGRHCAWWFAADAAGVASNLIEEKSAQSVLNGNAAAVHMLKDRDADVRTKFGRELQTAHDRAARQSALDNGDFMKLFEKAMQQIANEFYLKYTPPTP